MASSQRRFEVMGKNIYAILHKMTENQKLMKLMVCTTPNPLQEPDLTQEEIDKMINKNLLVIPKQPDEDNVKGSFIIVILDDIDLSTKNTDFKVSSLRFEIICPMDEWLMEGESLRPYLMMQEIDNMFNEQKIAGIGNLTFSGARRLTVSPYLSGYSVTYTTYEFN